MKEKAIKDDLSAKNPALQRLIRFLEGKGRLSVIAKNIGRSGNIFSNMIDRDTEPSVGLLRDLSGEFPEIDVHYISTGSVSMKQRELEDKLKELEQEMVYHKAIVTKFVMPGKTKAAINSPARSREIRMIEARQTIRNVRSFGRSARGLNVGYRANP